MPVLILLEETNPQFQIPPSTENIRCALISRQCLIGHQQEYRGLYFFS